VTCGEVLQERNLVVKHQGKQVANIPNLLLGDDAPDYDRPYEEPAYFTNRQRLDDTDIAGVVKHVIEQPRPIVENGAPDPESHYEDILRRILADPSVASKEWVYRQYDYMVRTNTLAGPGLTDAAVLRVKETGQGLAIATDGSGRLVMLDPALGAAHAVLESARNVLACGAEPIGITNCLNFGSPEKPDRMWQFVRCIEGMRHALNELELPVTGGNVSFYNETGGQPVLPTPVIGMVGLLEKSSLYVRNRVEQAGLELYLLGECDGRLDGSLLAFDLGRLRAGEIAGHDYTAFRACERFLIKAAQEKSLTACHDVSDGGLLTAVVEMCATGADIDLPGSLPELYDDDEYNRLGALFSEEGHRWIIAVTPEQRSWVRTAALHFNVKLKPLGRSAQGRLSVSHAGKAWFECPWAPLRQCHQRGLSGLME
jgi:phosphoribosylformylglycinamidine synthase subunit PurL